MACASYSADVSAYRCIQTRFNIKFKVPAWDKRLLSKTLPTHIQIAIKGIIIILPIPDTLVKSCKSHSISVQGGFFSSLTSHIGSQSLFYAKAYVEFCRLCRRFPHDRPRLEEGWPRLPVAVPKKRRGKNIDNRGRKCYQQRKRQKEP